MSTVFTSAMNMILNTIKLLILTLGGLHLMQLLEFDMASHLLTLIDQCLLFTIQKTQYLLANK